MQALDDVRPVQALDVFAERSAPVGKPVGLSAVKVSNLFTVERSDVLQDIPARVGR